MRLNAIISVQRKGVIISVTVCIKRSQVKENASKLSEQSNALQKHVTNNSCVLNLKLGIKRLDFATGHWNKISQLCRFFSHDLHFLYWFRGFSSIFGIQDHAVLACVMRFRNALVKYSKIFALSKKIEENQFV